MKRDKGTSRRLSSYRPRSRQERRSNHLIDLGPGWVWSALARLGATSARQGRRSRNLSGWVIGTEDVLQRNPRWTQKTASQRWQMNGLGGSFGQGFMDKAPTYAKGNGYLADGLALRT